MTKDNNSKKITNDAFPVQQLLQSAGIQTWTWDILHDQIIFNETNTKSATVYHSQAEFVKSIHPDDREQVLKTLNDSVDSGDDGQIMYHLLDNDQTKWIQARWIVNRNSDNFSCMVSGINVDISLISHLDQFLKDKDSAYQDLTDSIQDLLFVFDQELHYLYLNKASEKFVGISLNQAIGKHLLDIFPDTSEVRESEKIYLEVLKNKQPRSFEAQYTHDNKPLWFDINAYPSSSGIIVIAKDITQKKQEEIELRIQSDRLQKALNSSPIYVVMIDQHGKTILVNEFLQKDLGWTEEEWLTQNVLEKCYPDPVEYEIALDHIRKADGQWSEMKTHTKYGEIIDTEWANFRLSDGTNVGIGRNISDRKQAILLLQESESKFSTLFYRTPYPMVLSKSPDYQFVNVNDAWLELFGFTRDEVIGKTSSQLKVNPDEKTRAQIANTLQKNKTIRNLEQVLYKKNGDRLVTLLNIDLLKIGNENYVLNSLQNITQQKNLENSIRQSEELFKAITTNSPDHIFIQDQSLVYEFVMNPQLGLMVEEMVGKSDLELLPEHEAIKLITVKSQVMRDKQPYAVNIPLINLSGQTEYFEGTYVPRFDQNGEVDGLFGYFRNVTKQTIAEQELKRSIDDLNIMYQISKEFSQLYPLEILNKKIMEILDQYSYYEHAAILLVDDETSKLLPFAVSYKSKGPEYTIQELEKIRNLDLNIHKGITGWVVRNNKSYRSGNVRDDPHYIAFHPDTNSKICVPLQIGQKVLGVLFIETERMNAYHDEDQSLLESIAAHISIAIENARLLEELKQTSENLEKKVAERTSQLEQTLIQKSADEERQRLARELHDTVSQSMFSISLISESLPRLLSQNSPLFLEGLNDLTRLSRGALAEMRTLLFELRPAAIKNIRLNELLHLMVNGLMSQTRLKVILDLVGNHALPENVRFVLFRITQEALNNIIKHANASTVNVNRRDLLPIPGKRGVAKLSGLKLSIKDDGRGFIPKGTLAGMHGLSIMKERAKSIGANLSIKSKPGEGTEIIIIWRGEFLKETPE